MERIEVRKIMKECIEDADDMGYQQSSRTSTARALIAITLFGARMRKYERKNQRK